MSERPDSDALRWLQLSIGSLLGLAVTVVAGFIVDWPSWILGIVLGETVVVIFAVVMLVVGHRRRQKARSYTN